MRIELALPLLLPVALLAACQVSKDNANNTVSVSYNEDVAANVTADVANTAQNIAADIGNDVKNTGDKIQNSDVSLKVDTNVKTENKAAKK